MTTPSASRWVSLIPATQPPPNQYEHSEDEQRQWYPRYDHDYECG